MLSTSVLPLLYTCIYGYTFYIQNHSIKYFSIHLFPGTRVNLHQKGNQRKRRVKNTDMIGRSGDTSHGGYK